MGVYDAKIYDDLGRLIQIIKITNNKVDLSSYTSGVYFIQIQDTKDRIYRTKFLKE